MLCKNCDYFKSEFKECGYCGLTGGEVEKDDGCKKGFAKEVEHEKTIKKETT